MSELPYRDDLPPGCLPRDFDPPCDDSAEPEPERLACRQCGKPWDEPRLSPDGVCPMCREDLEER